MSFDFKGRRVVVCGGSRGIGRSIALGFAEAGAAVSICARGAAALAATREEIVHFGHKAHAESCDLADGASVVRYVGAAAEVLGGIDILVNNASGFGASDDDTGWAISLAVDVMATVRASNAAIPHIEKAGGGSIVNVSSISAYRATTRNPPYAAVKAALCQYTTSQAANLARKNIRVNAVAPGVVDTSMHDGQPKDFLKTLQPMGQITRVKDVVDAIVYLTEAGQVTGEVLHVDGGAHVGKW